MAFRRSAATAWGAFLPLACGAGAALCLQRGLFACAAVLLLTGLWSAAHTAWVIWRKAPVQEQPLAAAGASVEADLRLARSLLDETPAPLIIAGPDGALSAGNRAARRLFRVDDRLVEPPPELSAALGQGDGGRRLTVRLDTPDGPHLYAVSIAELISPRGALRLAILIDIEPEMRAAEAAALRELMQVLSHEIMNALTPVASLAGSARDILLEQASPPAEAVDALAILARRAEGLTRFVEAYRTLARLPEPVLARVRLRDLLEEAARLFRGRWAAQGVRLDLVEPDHEAVLEIDLDLMVHALANVLSNGAEAALTGGDAEPVVTLAADVSEGSARLIIDDNGPGVRPADREAIFRPFFTTKSQGSGVGLSFARQVAFSHGGSLVVTSPGPAGGARFILAL